MWGHRFVRDGMDNYRAKLTIFGILFGFVGRRRLAWAKGRIEPDQAMKDECHQFLTLMGQPPARLNVEQAAWVLGCQAHDVPILVAARLLKPLGNPPANGVKYFATTDLLELVKDRAWLVRMTNTVCQHWQGKNARKKDSNSRDLCAVLIKTSSISDPHACLVD